MSDIHNIQYSLNGAESHLETGLAHLHQAGESYDDAQAILGSLIAALENVSPGLFLEKLEASVGQAMASNENGFAPAYGNLANPLAGADNPHAQRALAYSKEAAMAANRYVGGAMGISFDAQQAVNGIVTIVERLKGLQESIEQTRSLMNGVSGEGTGYTNVAGGMFVHGSGLAAAQEIKAYREDIGS